MAQQAGTFSSYDAVGNREDLIDIIFDISPTDTPVMSAAKRKRARATLHEWQTDTLAAAATNAQVEGDVTSFSQPDATTRLNNQTQISSKSVLVSRTQNSVDTAGRAREFAYQKAKRMKELKRDMELDICANNAKVVGNDSTARESAGILSWLTQASRGSGGTDPTGDGSDAAGNGTQRLFSEDLLLDVHQEIWTSGGDPSMLVVGPYNRRISSSFSGVYTSGGDAQVDRRQDTGGKKLTTVINVYVGPFGELTVVPDRFSSARDAMLLDPEYFALAFLDEPFYEDLAKTGDHQKGHIITEYSLEMCNPSAHGTVADLNTS